MSSANDPGTNSKPPATETPSGTHSIDRPKAPSGGEKAAAAKPAASEAYRKLWLGSLVALVTLGFGWYGRWLMSAKSFGAAVQQTSGWLTDLSGEHFSAHVLVLGPFAFLLAGVTALLVRGGLPHVWQSARRSATLGALLGACLLGVGLLSSGRVDVLSRRQWLFFVPVVPPVLLCYQALLVWRQRPRSLGGFSLGVSPRARAALENGGARDRFEQVYQQLLRAFGGTQNQLNSSSAEVARRAERVEEGSAYNPTFFVTNFAVPALLLLLVGFGALSMAAHHSIDSLAPNPGWDMAIANRGLRWGVAGAFVYVFVEFGARFFRSDLTVGAATWAIITLIVGPALAVLLAVGWQLQPSDSIWQSGLVLFFAGLAPRRVVTIVERTALQALRAPLEETVPKAELALTNLRGINAEIATRLGEENVHDISTLAYADPVRLVQSLPYDLRQVTDWIDQAQLAVALPKHYAALRENGITGAIDLAWRWLEASVLTDGGGQPKLEALSEAPASFEALVNGAKPDAVIVYAAGEQLFYEAQVCLLWVMYNSFSTTAGAADATPSEPQPQAPNAQ